MRVERKRKEKKKTKTKGKRQRTFPVASIQLCFEFRLPSYVCKIAPLLSAFRINSNKRDRIVPEGPLSCSASYGRLRVAIPTIKRSTCLIILALYRIIELVTAVFAFNRHFTPVKKVSPTRTFLTHCTTNISMRAIKSLRYIFTR